MSQIDVKNQQQQNEAQEFETNSWSLSEIQKQPDLHKFSSDECNTQEVGFMDSFEPKDTDYTFMDPLNNDDVQAHQASKNEQASNKFNLSDSPKISFSEPPDKKNVNYIPQLDLLENQECDDYLIGFQEEIGCRDLVGITNETGYWCFYIATVQALARTEAIPRLLDLMSFMPDCLQSNLMQNLHSIVSKLQNSTHAISIRRLVAEGPEAFRQTNSQQDASECLTLLLQDIERAVDATPQKQLLLDVFKSELELSVRSELTCFGCNTQHSLITESKYIHEIHFERQIQLSWQDEVPYECSRCSSSTAIQISRMVKLPQTLIVQLKRYQFCGSETKKLIGPVNMPLTFEDYHLIGFVCHIGWYQNSGHYVFYLRSKQQSTKWHRFDDSRVSSGIYGIDEYFWLSFHNNETPLISFYRKPTQ